MKTLLSILAILVISSLNLTAGMKIPKTVFTHENLDEATAKAVEENMALAFVYTDKETN